MRVKQVLWGVIGKYLLHELLHSLLRSQLVFRRPLLKNTQTRTGQESGVP